MPSAPTSAAPAAEPAPDAAAPAPRERAFLDHAASLLTADRMAALAERHGGAGSETKYLEPERWLREKWKLAGKLGLHEGPRFGTGPALRILDLGTGAGHFPFVCRYLGHDCVALDQPGIPLYDDFCALFGLDRVDHAIRPRQPLPALGARFDLVTAFMLGFNTRPDGKLFDLDDWSFFLDDVRDHQLVPGGRLCLKLIRQAKREGLKYGDPALMELFAARGGRFAEKHRMVRFEPLL